MKQWREDLWKKIQDRVIAHFEGESGIVVIEQTDNRRAEITNIEFHDWAVEVDYKDPDNFTINSTFYVGVQPDTKWEHHFIDVGVRLGRNPLGNFAPFIKRLNMGNDLRNYICLLYTSDAADE